MTKYEEEERLRPDFNGKERDGLYYKNEWIPWSSSDTETLERRLKLITNEVSVELFQ